MGVWTRSSVVVYYGPTEMEGMRDSLELLRGGLGHESLTRLVKERE
jgi:hypothetical protein